MKQRKRLLKILLWILCILVVAGVIVQIIFTQQVEKALELNIPKSISLTYDKLSTNVVLGRITLKGVEFSTSKGTIDLESKSIQVSGLRYLPLLRRGDIIISEVNLEEPFFIFRNRKNDTTANNEKGGSLKKINIKKF